MKATITLALFAIMAAFGAAHGASLRGVTSLPFMPGPVIMNPETPAQVFGPSNAECGCICPRDTCNAIYKCTEEARYLQLASCNINAASATRAHQPVRTLAPRDECTKNSDCPAHQFCLLSSIMLNPNVCVDRPTQHRKLFAFWKAKTWDDAGKDISKAADTVAKGVETAAKETAKGIETAAKATAKGIETAATETYDHVLKPAGEGIETAAKDTAKGVEEAGKWVAGAADTAWNKGIKPVAEGVALGTVYTVCKFQEGLATLFRNKDAQLQNEQCMASMENLCSTEFKTCNAVVGCTMSKLGTTDPCALTIANTAALLPTLINPGVNVLGLPAASQCIADQMASCAQQHVPARQLSSSKKCGNAAGEAACIAACASVVGMPLCLSDECYGPNGPDFSPSCKASTK